MSQQLDILVGRLGRDPDFRYTQNQKAICYLSVAINDKESESTTWKKVVVWEKQAEQCSVYLKKGSQVFVQGQSQIKEFKNKNGEQKSYEEINAKLVGFTTI